VYLIISKVLFIEFYLFYVTCIILRFSCFLIKLSEILCMKLLRLSRSLAEINNDCIILGSWETEPHSRQAFVDYSVYFVCLHARDNSRRRLSFSRGATFLMQLAPFLLYKSHCGASCGHYIHTRIRAARSLPFLVLVFR